MGFRTSDDSTGLKMDLPTCSTSLSDLKDRSRRFMKEREYRFEWYRVNNFKPELVHLMKDLAPEAKAALEECRTERNKYKKIFIFEEEYMLRVRFNYKHLINSVQRDRIKGFTEGIQLAGREGLWITH